MKNLIILICLVIFLPSTYAQVMLKLDIDKEQEIVSVLAVPQRTFNFPKEISGSIQVTFSVPRTSQFEPGTIFSGIPNVNWMRNNVLNDYTYSPERVYYTYGVEPLGKALQFLENKEVKLFSFRVDQVSDLLLLDPADPIIKKAELELSIDIANNVSIASTMGVANVYSGNIGEKSLKVNQEARLEPKINSVFPNPGENNIQVEWSGFDPQKGEDELELQFIDPATGRKALVYKLENKLLSNSKTVEVNNLISGNYIIRIIGKNSSTAKGYLFNKKR